MQNNVKYWQRLWKSSSDSQWEFLETGSDCWRGDVRNNVIYKGESLGLWEGKRTVFVHVIKQHQRWSEKKTCVEKEPGPEMPLELYFLHIVLFWEPACASLPLGHWEGRKMLLCTHAACRKSSGWQRHPFCFLNMISDEITTYWIIHFSLILDLL